MCVNARPTQGRPSCAARGGDSLAQALELRATTDPRLVGRIAVTRTGCLGPCFDGPNIVVYPEGVWYAGVGVGDVDELVEQHLVNGIAVERLVYAWPDDDADADD